MLRTILNELGMGALVDMGKATGIAQHMRVSEEGRDVASRNAHTMRSWIYPLVFRARRNGPKVPPDRS